MAKSHIELEIDSKYNGEGFKKADSAVRNFSRQAKTATDSVSKITNALGTLDGKAGKIAGSIGNIFASFAHGGVIGLAISGITAAFSLISDKLTESKRKVDEFAEKLKTSIVDAVSFASKNSKDNIGDLIDESSRYAQNIANINKHIGELNTIQSESEKNSIIQQGITDNVGDNPVESAIQQKKINDISRQDIINDIDLKIQNAKAQKKNLSIKKSLATVTEIDNINSYLNEKTAVERYNLDNARKSYNSSKTIGENIFRKKLLDDAQSAYDKKVNEVKQSQEYKEKVYSEQRTRNQIETSTGDQIIELERTLKELSLQRNLALEKNKTGEMQDQKNIEKAYLKSYEEREKVEEQARKQAQEDLKDIEESYRKAAEERDKFEEQAEKQVKEAKRKEDAEKAQADIENKHKEKIKELDKKIEDAKQKQADAAEIQKFFADGGRMSDWYKPKHGDNDAVEGEKNLDKAKRNIGGKIDSYNLRYKDKNGNWRSWVGDDIKKQYEQWQNDMDILDPDRKKKLDQEIKQLEEQKKQLDKENHDNIKAIADALKNGGVLI